MILDFVYFYIHALVKFTLHAAKITYATWSISVVDNSQTRELSLQKKLK